MQPQVAAQLLDEGCNLTGLDVANESLMDEAISTAAAMHLACRSVPATDDSNPSAVLTFVCSPDLHLQTLIAVQTRADGLGVRILEADPAAVTGLGPGATPLKRAAAVPRHVRPRGRRRRLCACNKAASHICTAQVRGGMPSSVADTDVQVTTDATRRHNRCNTTDATRRRPTSARRR